MMVEPTGMKRFSWSSRGSSVAVTGIRFYQRHLSPYKGFRCAHAAYHGGESCSNAVLRLVEAKGVMGAWPDVRARFAECADAYSKLRESNRVYQGGGFGARGVCCCGPIPIPFRCGG